MIDYFNIYNAEEFYKSRGYKIIEVPWIVSDKAYSSTKPPGSRDFVTLGGNLVASGEQSFVQLMLENKLQPRKYQCTTPCFRDEQYDELHLPYFVKVELISYSPEDPESELQRMIRRAQVFFDYAVSEVIETDIGYDIVDYKTKIELGSYGIREFEGFKWVYGTGCAEPRFSTVLKMR